MMRTVIKEATGATITVEQLLKEDIKLLKNIVEETKITVIINNLY